VLDSSFNPPTVAHMRMARMALGEVPASRLLMLLAVNNADKPPKPAGFEQRLSMMWAFARDLHESLEAEAAGEGGEGGEELVVDLALTKSPFFYSKAQEIAVAEFYNDQDGGGGTMEQVFLVGFDTVTRILDAKYYKSETAEGSSSMQAHLSPFFETARLRVTLRPDDGQEDADAQRKYAEDISSGTILKDMGGLAEWASRITFVDGRTPGEKAVSSTLARETARRQDWAQLDKIVGPEVGRWVESEKLYVEDVISSST
jgi:hypothetical protein